ncbi:MAG: hypothetical protein N3H84_08455, partial [Candidatus Caldarchaeum sp.]|nr:hypothetical protein [Candidatus Caldarchaeum sp.]
MTQTGQTVAKAADETKALAGIGRTSIPKRRNISGVLLTISTTYFPLLCVGVERTWAVLEPSLYTV